MVFGTGAFLSESSEHEITAKKVHKDSTIVGGVMLKQVNFFLFLLH